MSAELMQLIGGGVLTVLVLDRVIQIIRSVRNNNPRHNPSSQENALIEQLQSDVREIRTQLRDIECRLSRLEGRTAA